MQLTREEAIANHRKMWNWIADETERWEDCATKSDYFNTFLICQYLAMDATAVNTLMMLPCIQFVVFALCFGAVIFQHAYLITQSKIKQVFMSNG